MKSEILKNEYNLEKHPEGGWFSESYTSQDEKAQRPLAGSIYFLLEKDDISHFHQIDCDELWYIHEGCGLKITSIEDGKLKEYYLGMNEGQNAMVLLPKGAIFAAENIDKESYTFISCATIPKFSYEGFRLVLQDEIKKSFPDFPEELLYLAFEK